ncbi:hypothetical protein KY361_02275 [Candidatus Woesearchaeota archaeon]|nr:hypothetical protein [Candidatus Woesearchaeota archaeon]
MNGENDTGTGYSLDAVAELIQYEAYPNDSSRLKAVNIMGVFLVGCEDDGTYIGITHTGQLANAESVPLGTDDFTTEPPRHLFTGRGTLDLLMRESPLYFADGSPEDGILYAPAGAFLATRDKVISTRFRPAHVGIEQEPARLHGKDIPPLRWSGLVPLTSYRMGPFKKGHYYAAIRAELPVSNIMEWYNISRERLWVDNPESLPKSLCDGLSLENNPEAGAWRRWIGGWKQRAVPAESYFIFMLPREWKEEAPTSHIVDCGLVPHWEESSRKDLNAYVRYRSNNSFRLLVDPHARFEERKLHFRQCN